MRHRQDLAWFRWRLWLYCRTSKNPPVNSSVRRTGPRKNTMQPRFDLSMLVVIARQRDRVVTIYFAIAAVKRAFGWKARLSSNQEMLLSSAIAHFVIKLILTLLRNRPAVAPPPAGRYQAALRFDGRSCFCDRHCVGRRQLSSAARCALTCPIQLPGRGLIGRAGARPRSQIRGPSASAPLLKHPGIDLFPIFV